MSGTIGTGYINLNSDVSVTPGVIAAGGSNFAANGLMVTANTRVPIGQVPSFPNLLAVQNYFGAGSTEAAYAAIYFQGFVNSNVKPGALLFAQYPWTAPVSAYLRGASAATLTLAQLQAISGTLIVTIDGTVKTASALNLSAATSFSNAAALIATALSATASYDSISGAFVISSATTGGTSTITYATGTTAAALGLASTSGGVTSQGAAIATPVAGMNAIYALSSNWFSFMTVFEPVMTDKVLFASWNSQQNNTTAYVMWDTTASQIASGTTGLAYQAIVAAGYGGTVPVYLDPLFAAGILGYFASVDFTQLNGTTTLKYRQFTGVTPSVTNSTAAANLGGTQTSSGYGINYYGVSGDSQQSFTYAREGTISGPFAYCDAYLNQAWMNNGFQIAAIQFLMQVKSVPYTLVGAAQIEAAEAAPINNAVNFGAITAGVTLSPAQISEVNAAAGIQIDPTLFNRGWYLQVLPGTAAQRAARASPPCTFWYTFGASVQHLALASLLVQ